MAIGENHIAADDTVIISRVGIILIFSCCVQARVIPVIFIITDPDVGWIIYDEDDRDYTGL